MLARGRTHSQGYHAKSVFLNLFQLRWCITLPFGYWLDRLLVSGITNILTR